MKSKLLISIFAFILGATALNTAQAQTYDPYAVQVINNLIANNGLPATPNAPETWKFATWNDETPKQIIELEVSASQTGIYMNGEASFAGLTTLQVLHCNYGYLTKLDVSNCPQLKSLGCMDNQLTEIKLTHYKQLEWLQCSKNKLSKLDVTNCANLLYFECYSNNLTELDVKNCTQLNYLNCSGNNLTELNVANNTQLVNLICGYNKLIALDLSKLDSLNGFQGQVQNSSPLTLYENEPNIYTLPLDLNSPVFENTAITYKDGVLKSNDNRVLATSFTVQTGKVGCELSGTMNFNYSDVGIDTMDHGEFNIYPNPTTGELRITNYELRIKDVEVFDVYGRKQKAESRKQKAEEETVLDIAHLPAGIYFVKIITEQGDIVKKIVKQ